MRSLETRLAAAGIGAGLFLAAASLWAAEPANSPATVTGIEGTTLSKVILTPKAAARLGIELTEVREMEMVRKRTVSGLVVAAPAASAPDQDPAASLHEPADFAPAAGPPSATAGKAAVLQVQVQPIGELDRAAGARSARVMPMDGAGSDTGWLVEPSAISPLGTVEEASRPLSYNLSTGTPGLVGPGRVLVELALSDSGTARKVVPYASVLYDIRGDTWVYTSPEPLAFVRHPIDIDYIDNGWAVLNEGPPAGSAVVAVGVAELYGTEFKIGK